MKEFLTSQGLEQVKAELERRKTIKRQEITQRLQASVEHGDLTENAEYTATKEEQAFNESKILELEAILRNVEIIESRPSDGTVTIGSKIIVSINNQTLEYQIVGSVEADPLDGKVSFESPLGSALIGKKAGETVEVKTPKGKQKYKIIKIE